MHLPEPSQHPKAYLPQGSHFKGELEVPQGLRLEGDVYGHIRTNESGNATILVEKTATVIGSIEAAHVIVHGRVQGPIVATAHVQLSSSAQVEGEVRYRTLDMHPEAKVQGVLLPILGKPVEVETAVEPVLLDDSKGPTDDEGKREAVE